MFKYYAYNVSVDNKMVGSRVLRVHFYRSPLRAMSIALKTVPEQAVILDFKRIN